MGDFEISLGRRHKFSIFPIQSINVSAARQLPNTIPRDLRELVSRVKRPLCLSLPADVGEGVHTTQ